MFKRWREKRAEKRRLKSMMPPSFIKQAFTLAYERAQTRKALRLLAKQDWSVDFLTAMLIRASNQAGRPLEMSITGPSGSTIRMNTIDTTPSNQAYRDDSIFNHLDNELKIRQFIDGVNK
jgi:hypothetical protein